MTEGRLQGKIAIVTGAGSRAEGIGNGRATAVLFAREGARVLLVDQHADAAERTQEMIRAEGGEGAVFVADVTRTRPSAGGVVSTSSTTTWASADGAPSWRSRRPNGSR
jgi:NAD(P)-dependent dehydrogenase (short-subunit alcohol dehydrogenase family)